MHVDNSLSKRFYFTGHLRHGSTRPLVPDQVEIPGWACRALLIGYPSGAIVSGSSAHSFAMMPDEPEPFYLAAPMVGGPCDLPEGGHFTSRATSAQDGDAVMDDASQVTHHGRGILQWAHWVMKQLPERLHIHINAKTFLSAFSYLENDRRVRLPDWAMAPSSSVRHPFGDTHLATQRRMLHDLYDRTAKGIPHLSSVNPYRDEYLVTPGDVVRPTCKYSLTDIDYAVY